MLLLAILVFLVLAWLMIGIIRGSRRLVSLSDIAPMAVEDQPRVSIIVPACNEAATIAPALATLLAQEYAQLEIIVVNDRSTDETGEILHEIQQRYPRLIVLDIDVLPDGLLTILPHWGILFCHGPTRLVFFLNVLLRLIFFGQVVRASGFSLWLTPAALITPYLTVYTILRATVMTLKNRGIIWRGSHYSLEELRRKNHSLL